MMKTHEIIGMSLVLGLATALLGEEPKAVAEVVLTAAVDRADALYAAGETVTFRIEGTQQGKPAEGVVVDCVISKDGVEAEPMRQVTLKAGQAELTGKLTESGFLRLQVRVGEVTAMAAAGVDPLKLEPSLPMPEDFHAFWKAQKAALAAVPMKVTMTPATTSVTGMELVDVQVDCLGGTPVSGYLAKPAGSKVKSLPAILTVHGAGVNSANAGVTSWAAREGGMLALDINAHGLPNGRTADFYKALGEGELRDYRVRGRENRETVYFKGMFLRVVRAIDFLTSQPEWDGKTLIVYGSSQGGFQAFAAAGLDERVTFICAGVPAGCDHTGMKANRVAGWPKLVAWKETGGPEEASLQAARYFDNVNFATRATCKGAAVTVGFIDTTCPPTSVYAAYNALRVPKKLHFDVLAGHTNTPAASDFMREAALAHVREMRSAK
jgi:cephalosporin-C deacetylase-like acetyl esterase